MDAIRFRVRTNITLMLLCVGVGATASSLAAESKQAPEPAAGVQADGQLPWLQPIASERPIRRMGALRAEFRRIRDLRRAQIQPEYERRAARGDDADAWREDTLREVARRDLRDLRARLDR